MAIFEGRVKRRGTPKRLKIQTLRPGHRFTHRLKDLAGVHFFDERRTEFIIHSPFFQKIDTFEKFGFICLFANKRPILRQAGLEIHRYIIKQRFFDERANDFRAITIGIELHRKTKRPYLLDEIFQIRHDSRLATRDHDPIKHTPSLIKKTKCRLDRNKASAYFCQFFRQNEFWIMAKTATKVAAANKDNARDFSWKIDECKFLNPAYDHGRSSLKEFLN